MRGEILLKGVLVTYLCRLLLSLTLKTEKKPSALVMS